MILHFKIIVAHTHVVSYTATQVNFFTRTLTAKARSSTPAISSAGSCDITHQIIAIITGEGDNAADSITTGETHTTIAKDQWRTFCLCICFRIGERVTGVGIAQSCCVVAVKTTIMVATVLQENF